MKLNYFLINIFEFELQWKLVGNTFSDVVQCQGFYVGAEGFYGLWRRVYQLLKKANVVAKGEKMMTKSKIGKERESGFGLVGPQGSALDPYLCIAQVNIPYELSPLLLLFLFSPLFPSSRPISSKCALSFFFFYCPLFHYYYNS